MTKTFTAEDFSNKPALAYREADRGNKVTINHSRYPDVIFELTARPRRANLELGVDIFPVEMWDGLSPDEKDHILSNLKSATEQD